MISTQNMRLLSVCRPLIWRGLLFSDGHDIPSRQGNYKASNRRFSRYHVILEKQSGANGQEWASILASVSTHVEFHDQQGNMKDKVAGSPLKSLGFTGITLALAVSLSGHA